MTISKVLFIKQIMILVLAGGFLVSCGGEAEADKEELLDSTDTVKTAVLNVAGELFSVPSPIQTAMLIQKSGITYDRAILSPAGMANSYPTDLSRALNLGVYGADLGYVALYSQTQDALAYLAAIKQLSDKLGISAAFDAPTMQRIQNNITNKDSMMVLVGLAYRASDAYLKDNQRTEISSMILAGGWLESMHFSIMAYRSKPSDQIRFRIAEQKQALSSIIKILGSKTDEEIVELTKGLKELSAIYEGISFKYNFVEPVHDTARRTTYINSTTEVIVSDEQLAKIVDQVKAIRAKIVITSKN